MGFYLAKTPRIFMRFFSNYTWCFDSNKKEIYLTFDDGPTPEVTEFVLNELQKYNAKATFFCIGKNIEKYPSIFKRIINEKHSVGNHTQNHFNGWKYSTEDYLENVLECENVIANEMKQLQNYKEITLSKTLRNNKKLYRPPYGKIKSNQAKALIKNDYKIIMWNVLSGDFDTSINKEKCLQNVIRNTKNGSIVVFHDSIKASKKLYYTLPKILKEFSKKGYLFKAIS